MKVICSHTGFKLTDKEYIVSFLDYGVLFTPIDGKPHEYKWNSLIWPWNTIYSIVEISEKDHAP